MKTNIFIKKAAFGIASAVFAILFFVGTTTKTYASDYDTDHGHQSNSSYGSQFYFTPSVDYYKSGSMQNFSYQNDVSFMNRTNVNFSSSQASESFMQGFSVPFYNHNSDGMNSGMSDLFMWLTGSFGGNGWNMF